MKECTICGLEKEWEDFSRDNSSKTGRRPSCKVCVNEMNRLGRRKAGIRFMKNQSPHLRFLLSEIGKNPKGLEMMP